MIAYYLNTADEATMRTALLEVGAVTERDGVLIPGDGVILDELGQWFEATGETTTDVDGNVIQVLAQVPGWFFNVYSVEPIIWPTSVIVNQPVTPWRILG